MVRRRAPGRICLLGEHCDWAGGASVVVPMEQGVEVQAEPAETLSATAVIEGEEVGWAEGEPPGRLFLVPAVAAEVAARWGVPPVARLRLEGDLPPGRGFSSSAAAAVALVRAFAGLHGLRPGPDEVADLAWQAEHVRAGVNCGRLDPLASAHALPLFLAFDGDAFTAEPLPARLDLAVGAFRRPRDTHAILDALGRHHRGEVPLRDFEAVRRVGAVRGAIEGFAAEARRGREALLEGDLLALGRAMNTCQDLYEEELMDTLPELRAPGLVRAVRALRAGGALGAKFSGAGGDGSVIGLFKPGGSVRDGVVALDALGLETLSVEIWCSV